MTISREDLDRGLVDLSDETTGETIEPVTPGDTLRELMAEAELSANRLGRDIDVPPNRLLGILAGERAITADTALRLGAYFGMSARFWLNLQTAHDLAAAERERGEAIRARVRPHAAA